MKKDFKRSLSIMKSKVFDFIPNNLKEILLNDPLVVIKNQNLFDHDLINLAASLSFKQGELRDKVLHWDFGPVMKMNFDPQARNYLFSEEKVPFHWDGAFYQEPQFLIFYCLQSEGEGGETLFSNSNLLYEDVKDTYPNFKLTYHTEKKVHYGGSFSTQLYKAHPLKPHEMILRFAEKVETEKNPVTLEINADEKEASRFYSELSQKLYDTKYCYQHKWQKGDLLIADNFTFLHGRNALKTNKERSFKRVQVL
jgi:alpha-ketoglutarate-dependent taurine dioxygenase